MNSPALVRPPFSRSVHRHGLSLMELLIATTISIMVMGATVTLFGVVGERINGGRAMIEVADRLRSTQNLLHHDLRGVTVSFLPWEQPSAGAGYFEILKGPVPDNRDANPNKTSHLVGYTQDVLMFTTRSPDMPFTGRFLPTGGGTPTTIESPVAEVVWYLQPSYNAQGQQAGAFGGATTYTLYRRQFLVIPSPVPATPPTGTTYPLLWFYDNYDISAHPDGNGNMIANSLADLSYRENRFAHNNFAAKNPWPYGVIIPGPALISDTKTYNNLADGLLPFQPPYLTNGTANPVGSQRYGEDVVLTNVLSFDVKVWDPGAEVRIDNSDPKLQRPLVPSDPGYSSGISSTPPQFGAYVDLNYSSTNIVSGVNDGAPINNSARFASLVPPAPPTYFAGPYYGSGKNSGLAAAKAMGNYATFDTWSLGNEYYNSAMTTAAQYNQSNNGFDNNNNGIVNDANERLTSPPYPVPLRGVQIKIRVYEPSTRQVREITIAETFLPD